MKKNILLLSIFIASSFVSFADEGMWLPNLLQSLNEKRMKKLGMKISAEDIYSINKSSLKDAIVSLGGFCTAEVISKEGLILTNHHCGFDAVQNHSSLEHNYIRDGFWAYEKKQELNNPGLFVSFIISIEEVTASILKDVNNNLTEKERQTVVDKNINELKKTYKKESYQDILIRSFFDGNKYYLFVTETYKDVRLVGTPPASIGNFGKDTDNWMWPRHTGDFSMFRIYADKNNHPAEYSADNVPYHPKKALTISLKGVKEGDFTMIFGFPGRTNEYLPSSAVKQIMNLSDPTKIAIRHDVLETLKSAMIQDEAVKIKYAAKYASIENAYKKWMGEVKGLTRTDALAKKKEFEYLITQKINSKPEWKNNYGNILIKLDSLYKLMEPLALARDYYNETMPRIETFNAAGIINSFFNDKSKDTLKLFGKLDELYKEADMRVDRALFTRLIEKFIAQQPDKNIPPYLKDLIRDKQINNVAEDFYSRSNLCSESMLTSLMRGDLNEAKVKLSSDPLFQMYNALTEHYTSNTSGALTQIQGQINKLQRMYMKAQMEVFADKSFYPDANSTMRVAYGNVKGYQPRDGMKYEFYTYMDGIMEKYKPGDYEFDVPQKLIELYEKKDFGKYCIKGKMPVCFIASNHTTGGNSGSPALDANGNLIGLNFDRVWEGTMSDINYDPSICRNIMVDIRYILFIIDKFAGAKNLIAELQLK